MLRNFVYSFLLVVITINGYAQGTQKWKTVNDKENALVIKIPTDMSYENGEIRFSKQYLWAKGMMDAKIIIKTFYQQNCKIDSSFVVVDTSYSLTMGNYKYNVQEGTEGAAGHKYVHIQYKTKSSNGYCYLFTLIEDKTGGELYSGNQKTIKRINNRIAKNEMELRNVVLKILKTFLPQYIRINEPKSL